MSFECFFFFKQKTAYEMRISDWSSDVCSSDLLFQLKAGNAIGHQPARAVMPVIDVHVIALHAQQLGGGETGRPSADDAHGLAGTIGEDRRSEEHTSELQSLMRISYAVFCLKKKKKTLQTQ